MTKECELADICGFMKRFRDDTNVVTDGWIRSFCEDRAKSESCERKKYHKLSGVQPADNIAPTGKII